MNGTEDVTDYYTVITADGTLKVTGSITYNENGGSGNVPEDSNQYDYDADITLMGAGELYRDNAVFLGWSEVRQRLLKARKQKLRQIFLEVQSGWVRDKYHSICGMGYR